MLYTKKDMLQMRENTTKELNGEMINVMLMLVFGVLLAVSVASLF